jgi:hypothetical protein
MTRTENLNLPQWEAADYVQRSDFNDAFASLDEGYGTAMTAAAQVTASLDGKADVDTVTAAVEALAAQHSSDVAKLGNCEVGIGSYVGAGDYGATSKNVLTFERLPMVLFIGIGSSYNYILVRGLGTSKCGNYTLYVTWGTDTVSWVSSTTAAQCNEAKTTYTYVALYDMAG